MPGEHAGEFSFFWSIVVPALMAAGSVLATYLLYRHFAGKVSESGRHSHGKDG